MNPLHRFVRPLRALFGKGKLVVKKRQRILPGETVVIAGDDKDYNAWFVVLNTQKSR